LVLFGLQLGKMINFTVNQSNIPVVTNIMTGATGYIGWGWCFWVDWILVFGSIVLFMFGLWFLPQAGDLDDVRPRTGDGRDLEAPRTTNFMSTGPMTATYDRTATSYRNGTNSISNPVTMTVAS